MKHGIASKKGHTINYKRYFLASNIGSKSIFNNIIGVIKTMLNKIKMWLKGVKDIKWLNAYKKTINSIDKNVIKNVLKIANNRNRLGVLTKRIDDNYDELDKKIDALDCNLISLSSLSYNRVKALEDDIKALNNKINMLINNDINDKESKSKFKLSYKLSNNDIEMALGKIIFDINEGIKYGSLRGINSHKKELRTIVNKHINLSN